MSSRAATVSNSMYAVNSVSSRAMQRLPVLVGVGGAHDPAGGGVTEIVPLTKPSGTGSVYVDVVLPAVLDRFPP